MSKPFMLLLGTNSVLVSFSLLLELPPPLAPVTYPELPPLSSDHVVSVRSGSFDFCQLQHRQTTRVLALVTTLARSPIGLGMGNHWRKSARAPPTNDCVQSAPFSANPSIRILSKPVPTTHNSFINMAQAQVLTSFVSFLNASGKCWTVTQKVREASSGVSDSDDEADPDPAISPAFTDSELLAVQIYYVKLCSAFRSAVVHQFTNAAGKMFFYHLAEFILILRPNKQ